MILVVTKYSKLDYYNFYYEICIIENSKFLYELYN